MEIILLHDVSKLGQRGDTCSVQNGYARNFLFPKGLAVRADTAKKKELEIKLKAFAVRDDREEKVAADLATTMGEVSVKITAAAGDEDKLFGSVTSQMIAAALTEKGHAIDSKQIELEDPIKSLGNYSIPVKLHKSVTVEIQLWVERDA